MTIGVIGTDHARTSLVVRERLAVAGDQLDALLDALNDEPCIDEAAVLSTCNRTEIYVAAPDVDVALQRAFEQLCRVTGVPKLETAGAMERRVGAEAARHLFAVAAGLCSLALGETQIATQVREAFDTAAERSTSGADLHALARGAVRCGKRVRAETSLGTVDTSVGALVVEMAARRLGGLRGRRAVLVGAGRINEVTARLLREANVGSLVVVSRTRLAAARLAALCGGDDAALEDLPSLLSGADLAITATRAPRPLVFPNMVAPRERSQPLLLYDIAVPRNVDPAIGAVAGVEVVDMDALRAEQGGHEYAGVAGAWRIVDSCLEQYEADRRLKRAVPLIVRLREHVDRQKDVELARTLAGLDHLSPDDREAVELLAHRLVNRMFHHLATRLKAAAADPNADAYLAALSFLFDGAGTQHAIDTAPESESVGNDR